MKEKYNVRQRDIESLEEQQQNNQALCQSHKSFICSLCVILIICTIVLIISLIINNNGYKTKSRDQIQSYGSLTRANVEVNTIDKKIYNNNNTTNPSTKKKKSETTEPTKSTVINKTPKNTLDKKTETMTTESTKPTLFNNTPNNTLDEKTETTTNTLNNETEAMTTESSSTQNSDKEDNEIAVTFPVYQYQFPRKLTKKSIVSNPPFHGITPKNTNKIGKILNHLNTNIETCTDFYTFSCGGNLAPKSKSALATKMFQQLISLQPTDVKWYHLKNMYNSCIQYQVNFNYTYRVEIVSKMLRILEFQSDKVRFDNTTWSETYKAQCLLALKYDPNTNNLYNRYLECKKQKYLDDFDTIIKLAPFKNTPPKRNDFEQDLDQYLINKSSSKSTNNFQLLLEACHLYNNLVIGNLRNDPEQECYDVTKRLSPNLWLNFILARNPDLTKLKILKLNAKFNALKDHFNADLTQNGFDELSAKLSKIRLKVPVADSEVNQSDSNYPLNLLALYTNQPRNRVRFDDLEGEELVVDRSLTLIRVPIGFLYRITDEPNQAIVDFRLANAIVGHFDWAAIWPQVDELRSETKRAYGYYKNELTVEAMRVGGALRLVEGLKLEYEGGMLQAANCSSEQLLYVELAQEYCEREKSEVERAVEEEEEGVGGGRIVVEQVLQKTKEFGQVFHCAQNGSYLIQFPDTSDILHRPDYPTSSEYY